MPTSNQAQWHSCHHTQHHFQTRGKKPNKSKVYARTTSRFQRPRNRWRDNPASEHPANADSCTRGNVDIKFDQIQGNIFGGFNKDHQVNILFRIDDAAKAKITLGPVDENDPFYPASIFGHVKHSTSEKVLAFNEQFRAIRRSGLPEGSILATWTNLVFTATGVSKFGTDITGLPAAFTDGMAKRAAIIGDVDFIDRTTGETAVTNSFDHWNDGMDVSVKWDEVHGMLLVASDDPAQLDRCEANSRLANYLAKIEAFNSGLSILGIIRGETRIDAGPNQVGHEHFGFKDGVSQPGIRGVDAPDDPLHNPEQGNPGQDLLHPGEFVLGYPTQIPHAEAGPDPDSPNPCQGPLSGDGLPAWVENGSFLVFRRLAQDVKGFRDAVSQSAAALGITTDLMGAKLVGRYVSGAPLEALKFQAGTGGYEPPMTDPGIETANPALANSNALNNAFEYGEDVNGSIVPLAAHIRKAYPRDHVPFKGGAPSSNKEQADAESFTQTHRLLRRGIPFGTSLDAEVGGGSEVPRGLLFFAYQSDIERQFEFVQKSWVNEPNFPETGAGQDPIITTNTPSGSINGCPFHPRADKSKCPVAFKHFVKTRGGGYFFSPSLDTLGAWLNASVA